MVPKRVRCRMTMKQQPAINKVRIFPDTLEIFRREAAELRLTMPQYLHHLQQHCESFTTVKPRNPSRQSTQRRTP